MKLLITGGGGFVGTRLARALLARGNLAGARIEHLVLADQVAPAADLATDARVETRIGPLLAQCTELASERFDGVFHLASAVSGECEADFDLGLRSNLDTTRALLDALRASVRAGAKPARAHCARAARPVGHDAGDALVALEADVLAHLRAGDLAERRQHVGDAHVQGWQVQRGASAEGLARGLVDDDQAFDRARR